MTRKSKKMDWKALVLAIKIDAARSLEEEARARGNTENAEKARKIARELESQVKK